jgi:hypothetical protein
MVLDTRTDGEFADVRNEKLVAEALERFENTEDWEHRLLEAANKQRLVKSEKTILAAVTFIFRVRNSLRSIIVISSYELTIEEIRLPG